MATSHKSTILKKKAILTRSAKKVVGSIILSSKGGQEQAKVRLKLSILASLASDSSNLTMTNLVNSDKRVNSSLKFTYIHLVCPAAAILSYRVVHFHSPVL